MGKCGVGVKKFVGVLGEGVGSLLGGGEKWGDNVGKVRKDVGGGKKCGKR